MPNFFEHLLKKFNIPDEEDFDDMDDYDDEPVEKSAPKIKEKKESSAPVMRRDKYKSTAGFSASKDEAEEDYYQSPKKETRPMKSERTQSSPRVVPMRSAMQKAMEMYVMKPTRFEDSQDICDMLVNNCPTIMNLDGLDIVLAQRIMDFVAGAVYAMNAQIHQISGMIFIVTPMNVDISGDYLSYIEENGFEVPTLNA
mgnify:CR=1 FL=1